MQFFELGSTTDQFAEMAGQIRRGPGRPQGWEIRRQTIGDYLNQMLGAIGL